MANGEWARVVRHGDTAPLLALAPGLPYTFAPPEVIEGALDVWVIVWLTVMVLEMIISGWNIPIG